MKLVTYWRTHYLQSYSTASREMIENDYQETIKWLDSLVNSYCNPSNVPLHEGKAQALAELTGRNYWKCFAKKFA